MALEEILCLIKSHQGIKELQQRLTKDPLRLRGVLFHTLLPWFAQLSCGGAHPHACNVLCC